LCSATSQIVVGACTICFGFCTSWEVRLAWLVAMCTEARVREAEETVRLSELLHSDVPPSGPSGSERYEAFLDWQQFGRLVEP